ncbi:MAG: restriction endonuclease subunit S [Ruminococcaceae bacterium]|nr:restriction endonuclease subunit S [Oscillospiraceae bacterium]
MVDNLARVDDYNDSELEVVINEAPVKWCSVSLSEMINRGKRLEASVFDVDAKQAWNLINSNKFSVVPIGGKNGLSNSYTCGRFKRVWVTKSEFPIFQPSSIVDVKPSPDGYISKKTKVDIDSLRVHKGQILLTCSGTIGKVAMVSNTLDNAVFSHDLLRIDCKNPVDSGYLYAYLKSKIGNKILITNRYGAVITHIESEHLSSVPIPNAPNEIKEKIHNLIVHSYELRDASNALIDEATKLLIDELHLPPIEDFDAKYYQKNVPVETFNVKLSEMNGRADASYHVPIVNAIVEHMKKYAEKVTTISDERISSDVILPGRFKRVYVEDGFGKVFIGGKQLYELDPSNKKFLSLAHHEKRITQQLELHENMILITCSGTVGKVALVGKQWENWTANQHIIRVVPANREIAGYISIFLSTDYGHELIKRFIYGSVVDEIDDNHVRQIAIPILKNKKVQEKINNLALEANEKRFEAYKFEQEAIKILEEKVIYAK